MEAWVSLQVRKADAYQFSLAERQIEAHVTDPQRAEADLRAMERHNDAAHKAGWVLPHVRPAGRRNRH